MRQGEFVVGDLFSGIGGFSLAAEWMGWRTAWFSEIDPYASRVLAHHWPDVPNLGDIRAIRWEEVEAVDVLTGGFPCQDISNAGKREGITGARSGLWSCYADAIRHLRPRYVVVENVAALAARGLGTVLGDLAALGYDAEWQVLSAAEVGAPHRRERLWITAYANGVDGRTRRARRSLAGRARQPLAERSLQDVADAAGIGARCHPETIPAREPQPRDGRAVGDTDRARQLQPQGRVSDEWGRPRDPSWWRTEPDVGRVAYGVPAAVDRLRGLGNSIVPRCAYEIFRALEARHEVAEAA